MPKCILCGIEFEPSSNVLLEEECPECRPISHQWLVCVDCGQAERFPTESLANLREHTVENCPMCGGKRLYWSMKNTL